MNPVRWFVCALFVVAGCTPEKPLEKLIPVEGKVTVKGQPLSQGSILFTPDKEKGNKNPAQPSGKIKDGVYSLLTADRPGAPAGAYKIVIIANIAADSTTPVRWLANPRYATDRSGLRAEVVENPAANAYTFDLEP